MTNPIEQSRVAFDKWWHGTFTSSDPKKAARDAWNAATAKERKHLEAEIAKDNTLIEALTDGQVQLSEQVASLTLALEKAEKIVDAAKNLVNVKGRHHSEIAMSGLIAALSQSPKA